MNFTFEGLKQAQATVESINDFYARLEGIKEKGKGFVKTAQKRCDAFMKRIDDDLDTPRALAELFALIGEANKAKLGREDAATIKKVLEEMDAVMGFLTERAELTKEENAMVEKREDLRAKKLYREADKIREELAKKGILLEDTAGRVRWSRHATGKA